MIFTPETHEIIPQVVREHLQETKLLEFQQAAQTIEVRVSHLHKDNETLPWLRFEITRNGKLEGYIIGEFSRSKENERVFYAHHTENKKVIVDYEKYELARFLKGHIPGVVNEAIAQILVSEIIQKWYSSRRLSKGGSLMYSRLLQNPRLQGQKFRNENIHGVFLIEKRKTVATY